MAWFRRSKQNIDPSSGKKEVPDGSWIKCNGCNEMFHRNQIEAALYTCPKCNYHFRVDSKTYLGFLLDPKSFREYDKKLRATDPLGFVDSKAYKDRIDSMIEKTGLYDAIRCGVGKIDGMTVSIGAMDFAFIGGSMGSVVGEKIARAVDRAIKRKCPLILVSSSGGARMMEGALSLMQMAKTAAKLVQLAEKKLPYISIMLDPTTGGVTASFAMLGDVNIAEPKALIGFAGPRVIKQTIGKDLPEGFQQAEFLLEKGFVDMVVHRKDMRETVLRLLRFFQN